MHDKISIVIPVYNVERYVIRCIESVINQSYKNLEIIIINDGSSDKSGEICNQYSKIDNRIIFITQENQGLSMARNNGIDIASGKYIGFVDSDDYIDSDMFELLYDNICKYKADISMCNIICVDENGKNIFAHDGGDTLKNFNLQSSNNLLLENENKIIHLANYDNNFAWNKLYKKSLFSKIYFPRGKLYEDIFTIYKLFDESNKIIASPKYKYYYVQRENSINTQLFNVCHLDMIEANIERHSYLSVKYPEYEPLFRKYIFTSLLYCLNKANSSNSINSNIGAIEKVISNVKRYDISKSGLSVGQENLLKIIFSDINKYKKISKFYRTIFSFQFDKDLSILS